MTQRHFSRSGFKSPHFIVCATRSFERKITARANNSLQTNKNKAEPRKCWRGSQPRAVSLVYRSVSASKIGCECALGGCLDPASYL